MHELEERLGHQFKDQELFHQALTHRSFAHERKQPAFHNERLELLGDAVIGLVITDLLVELNPEFSEGALSKARSLVVNEAYLSQMAQALNLGQHLRLGRGEMQTAGHEKPRLLACGFEALMGALYRDAGFERAYQILKDLFMARVGEAEPMAVTDGDYKTQLQEFAQAKLRVLPTYQVIREEGPAHSRWFEIQVRVGDLVQGSGQGRSKKLAEQNAAQAAIQLLKDQEIKSE